MLIRERDKWGRGRKSESSITGAHPEDQDAVDRRRNNKIVIKAVSATPLRNN